VNALLPWKDIASAGGFTTAEAGRLLRRPASDIASWLRGKNPIILPDYEPVNGRLVLSFDALIEARAIAHFLSHGMERARLRHIMGECRKRTNVRHPLAGDKDFVTDGFRLFEMDDERLINLVNDVYAEPQLMAPALKGQVTYQHGRAAFLTPDPEDAPLVRIDPRHAFGRPVVIEGGKVVTTSALAAEARNDTVEGAADWFGVSPAAASQAVLFEGKYAA